MPRRGHAPQGRDEQGTPGGPADPDRAPGRRRGFPLEVHCFEGNKAETRTLIPILQAFQERHGVSDMAVVADAGMLSTANLNAVQDAGFSFIVGSRISKAPNDLAEHFKRHGDYIAGGQILESSPVMEIGKAAPTRRIVYQDSFKRRRPDAALPLPRHLQCVNHDLSATVRRASRAHTEFQRISAAPGSL
jgi:Transposase DDE domain